MADSLDENLRRSSMRRTTVELDESPGQSSSRRVTALFITVTVLGVLSASAAAGTALTAPGPISLASTLALLLWLQRRYPLTALVIGVATVAALRVSHLTEAGWLWPATLLYAQAALARGTATVVTIAIVNVLTAFNLDWTVLQHTARESTATVGTDALWLCATLAITVAYRTWRRLQAESLQRLRTELDEQRTAERLRLAQEVHDAVAHTLAVVGVHVNVAADALDSDPVEARAALRLAQDVRRRAMADLSALVGVLRAPDATVGNTAGDAVGDAAGDAVRGATGEAAGEAVDGTASDPAGEAVRSAAGDAAGGAVRGASGEAVRGAAGEAAGEAVRGTAGDPAGGAVRGTVGIAPPVMPPDLDGLVEGIRSTGLDAVLEADGSPDDVPLPVLLVIAAIIRESLTNVVKHAAARHVTVRVHYGPPTSITVLDDGSGSTSIGVGNGLRGLEERVTALGGTFSAGPAEGGFAVRAKIPA
ncbi:hypothetical protein Dvina_45890 [Dactylosporangium vinaceum]|nr:histidine kinase [Dactylosporangium vinaceum]UAB95293.1 hypothetical protein Dvina_45890 [Dactylosporangium vinaceum]